MKNYIIILLSLLIISCSSEKKLHRAIQKHGIKESVGYVVTKYPEYFKQESVTIHDTLIKRDTIIIEPKIFDFKSELDSLNMFKFENEKLKLSINKNTGKGKITIKYDTIFRVDTLYRDIKCPEIICPDIDKLNSHKSNKNYHYLLIILVIIALFLFLIYNNKNR